MINANEKPMPRIDIKLENGDIVQVPLNGPKSALFFQKAYPALKTMEQNDNTEIDLVTLTGAVNFLLPEEIAESLSLEHYMQIFQEALEITVGAMTEAGKSSEKKSKNSVG